MWSLLLLCSLTFNTIPTTLAIPIYNADRELQDRSGGHHRHHRHHKHHRHGQQSHVMAKISQSQIGENKASSATPIVVAPALVSAIGLAKVEPSSSVDPSLVADADADADDDEDCDGLSDEPGTDITSTPTSTSSNPTSTSTPDLNDDDDEDDEDCDALDDDPSSVSASSTTTIPSLTSTSSSSTVSAMTSTTSTVNSILDSPDSSGTSGKRGLGWPWDAKPADFDLFKSAKITWLYNWETWSPNPPSGITYIPTQRTTKGDENLLKSVQNVASKTILGWNEPDNAGQANLSPSAAAPLWKQYFNPLKSAGFKVVSPAITNSGAANQGLAWLKQFNTACDNACAYDVVATHWYGGGIDDFKSHVQSVHDTFGKPVWVTEFALTDSSNQARNLEFLKQAMIFLDSAAYVEKYAYFGAFRGDKSAMITQNGQLNDLGKLYLS